MGSFDRSKKRIQIWKKAILHFSLCFVMGFFTGFAPTSTASIFPSRTVTYQAMKIQDTAMPEPVNATEEGKDVVNFNRSLNSEAFVVESPVTVTGPVPENSSEVGDSELNFQRHLIIITTTISNDPFQEAFLRRLANALKLVPPPLLWVIVESHSEASKTAEILRRTGIMYRHLVYKDNFTDPETEIDHQRNVALNHIEYHRLDGIVHFAGLSNIYDLHFFHEIRDIEVFGTWPMASVSANRKRVAMEGPVCSSSQVLGWHFFNMNNGTTTTSNNNNNNNNNNGETRLPTISLSSFAFNSSILWDPERWGRPASVPDTSQDSIKFVQEVVLEDESKLRAIPPDCSRIMLWNLHIPRTLSPASPHPVLTDQNPDRG